MVPTFSQRILRRVILPICLNGIIYVWTALWGISIVGLHMMSACEGRSVAPAGAAGLRLTAADSQKDLV